MTEFFRFDNFFRPVLLAAIGDICSQSWVHRNEPNLGVTDQISAFLKVHLDFRYTLLFRYHNPHGLKGDDGRKSRPNFSVFLPL